MKLKTIFTLIILFFCSKTFYSIKFDYKYKINQNITIKKEENLKYYINGEYLHKNKIKNILNLKVESFSNNTAMIKADTNIFEIQKYFNREKENLVSSLNYVYFKDTLGKTKNMENHQGLYDFLVFPDREIEIGDTWDTDDIFNIRLFNSSNIIKLDIVIKYKFIGFEDENDKKVALITADLIFLNKKNREYLNSIQIFKINGFGNYLIKFDIREGNIISVSETFDYLFILHDYRIIEVEGNSFLKCSYSEIK